METKPLRFICEPIEVEFGESARPAKKPSCPDRFTWHGQTHTITAELNEWHDYTRRGRAARNMRPDHAAAAEHRGSWGVGRDYFRVRTLTGRVFDIYYDRAPKNAHDRKGNWFIYREMSVPRDE